VLKVKGSRDTVDTTKLFIESGILCLSAGKKVCIQVVRARRSFSLHLHVEMNTSNFKKKVKKIILKQNIKSNYSSV